MNEEEDLCNFVAEIHGAIMDGVEPDAVVAQLTQQGFPAEDADKLVTLALCVGRIAVAQAEGIDDRESIEELDGSGLHTELCTRLVEEATLRFSGNASDLSVADQFAIDVGLNLEQARSMFQLSQAIASDIGRGKTREAIIVRLEISNFMPGEESEFVDHTLWAWATAREIVASNGSISDELLTSDPPWAVYTLLSFLAELQASLA